jgi:hypothetical protein
METLQEAQEYVRRILEEGKEDRSVEADCPCCSRKVKMYHRKVYDSMVTQLVQMTDPAGVHGRSMTNGLASAADYTKLRYWELVEQLEDGAWIITGRGQDFLAGRISIPKYAYVFKNTVYGFSNDEQVTVRECVSEDFNLDEMMDRQLELDL